MTGSEAKKLPKFKSIDKLVDFFDTHDMGGFYEQLPESDFEVDIKRRKYFFALDVEVVKKLTEIAKLKQITSEALANIWLIEKIKEQTNCNQQL